MLITRRDGILSAALECFLVRGLDGASIEQICRRSGASVGSVYHHFGGKEGLAGAVYLAALVDYQAIFLAVLREHADDAQEGVRAIVGAHLRWCLFDRPDRARFLLFHGAAARGAGGLQEANDEFFAAVLVWWRPHAHYGTLRELGPDLDLAYALWLGPAQEYCRLRLARRNLAELDRSEPMLADAAWQALKAN